MQTPNSESVEGFHILTCIPVYSSTYVIAKLLIVSYIMVHCSILCFLIWYYTYIPECEFAARSKAAVSEVCPGKQRKQQQGNSATGIANHISEEFSGLRESWRSKNIV